MSPYYKGVRVGGQRVVHLVSGYATQPPTLAWAVYACGLYRRSEDVRPRTLADVTCGSCRRTRFYKDTAKRLAR